MARISREQRFTSSLHSSTIGLFRALLPSTSLQSVQLHLQGNEILSGAVMNGMSNFSLFLVISAQRKCLIARPVPGRHPGFSSPPHPHSKSAAWQGGPPTAEQRRPA